MRKKYGGSPYDAGWMGDLLRDLKAWPKELEGKGEELCRKLAEAGAEAAKITYAGARYDGPDKEITVQCEKREGGAVAIVATGSAVLFIEFGAGKTYGGGHPGAAKYGMGPGTYPIPPGKGHWNDPNGWYLPKEKGGGHTYGNPPAKGMWEAQKTIEDVIAEAAREVFGDD